MDTTSIYAQLLDTRISRDKAMETVTELIATKAPAKAITGARSVVALLDAKIEALTIRDRAEMDAWYAELEQEAASDAADAVATAEKILAAALPYTTAAVYGEQQARYLAMRRAGNAFIVAQREQEEAQEAYDTLIAGSQRPSDAELERVIRRLVDAGFARWQAEGRNVAAYEAWMGMQA